MQKETKKTTSKYHPTKDWAEPNLSFSQSPLYHIASMNVGSYGLNQNRTNRASRGQTKTTLYHSHFT